MILIRVANASAFFQEKGLDMNGIFCLLTNAVSREFYNTQTEVNPYDIPPGYIGWSNKDYTVYAIGILSKWQGTFKGDLDFADKRIKQYYEDYGRLHNIRNAIASLSFWDYLFRSKKEVKELFAEQRNIESMEISVADLIEIAYYKYVQSKLGDKEDFIKEFSELMNQKSVI